jgi:hypothetical protein
MASRSNTDTQLVSSCDGSEAGLKACNIAFRLTDMDKWVREAAAHQEKVDGIPHGPDGDYRPPQPILGPLGQSEESMMRFCEQATVVLTDFGRCEFGFVRRQNDMVHADEFSCVSIAVAIFEGSDQIARFNNSFVPPEHRLLRTGKVTTAADIWGVGTIVSFQSLVILPRSGCLYDFACLGNCYDHGKVHLAGNGYQG